MDTLPVAKIGWPLLLGKDLDKIVQDYLRENRGVINTLATAVGMVKKKDPLPKDWVCDMLQQIGFVKRKGTTKDTLQVEILDEEKYEICLTSK